MAELIVRGRIAHLKRREYDFVSEDGRRLYRDGADLYLMGQVLDDTPTVVQVEHAEDRARVAEFGQGAVVELVCTKQGKNLVAAPGLLSLVDG